MTTDAQTLVGIIDNIEIKDGKSERGPWRLHKFKIRGPTGARTYVTFDKGWPTNLIGGETYRFTFTEKRDGEFTNYTLTSATQVDPSEFGAQPPSNGEFKQPYEPLTDVAKAAHQAAPQAEYKSPSRSYDQNADITRRSIERQIALKAAVDMLKNYGTSSENVDLMPEAVMACANAFFTWLREAPTSAPESHAEPVSEDEEHEVLPDELQELREVPSTQLPVKTDHFADVGAFRKALKDEFKLATTAEVNKALDQAGWGPLAQVGNLDEAFAAIKAHRSEPVANTEAT
ncbi:hypothetical protein LCGC14_1003110 [marine sediment metagenome]|uniref:Uncharacterized protein n=1 Tax=marine sediment metagenome TaxID=412755 RepID=A0A0F9QKY8_9ZZZZ